ncbi:MAG: sodium:proton antiporter [Thermoprotei archaeon]|nr:MAG: sodium:proton antiporter [Thermoprotei archaeon]
MPLILAAIGSTLALIASIVALLQRDVLKAIILSGIESTFFALLLTAFLAPDLLIAYVAIGLGINSVILLYALRKGERYEE